MKRPVSLAPHVVEHDHHGEVLARSRLRRSKRTAMCPFRLTPDDDLVVFSALLPTDASPVETFDGLVNSVHRAEFIDCALASLLGVVVDNYQATRGDLPVQRVEH